MKIDILVGTTSGNTEFLALALQDHITARRKHQVVFHDQPILAELPTANACWLICAATHGAGEHAESIADFVDELDGRKPDLSTLNFALIQIGDSSYDSFCASGQAIHEQLLQLGAKPVTPHLTIDMQTTEDPEQLGIDWLDQWLK